VRPGPWVAELTGLLDLPSWSAGMRVIVYKERPHPGVQLRFTGIDGHRVTCFATDTRTGQLADLELRHRRRARCEDRIRCAKATSLRNLPLHGFDQNQIWCELVAMACELTTWMAILALKGPACAGEPKRLRLRLFSAAGRLARGGRRLRLRLLPAGSGPPRSPPRSPACTPLPPADQPESSLRPEGDPWARGTPPTRRDSRAAAHGQTLKISNRHSLSRPRQHRETLRLTEKSKR
jgi:hypothetical protein